VLLDIGIHEAFLGLLFNLREETVFFAFVVVGYHLVPALAVADEVFAVFWLDVRGLQVHADFLLASVVRRIGGFELPVEAAENGVMCYGHLTRGSHILVDWLVWLEVGLSQQLGPCSRNQDVLLG
jgi:hypothetical protein